MAAGLLLFIVVPALFLIGIGGLAVVLLAKSPPVRIAGGVVAAVVVLLAALLAIVAVLRDPMSVIVMLPFIVLGVLAAAFWVWMLADCALNEPDTGNDKVVWILIIIFTQIVGAAIYFFARRPRRVALHGH